MFLKKYRQLLIGIIIGLLCALPCGALAKTAQQVSAWAAEQISFVFDGEKKELPAGYTVLLYENHTYVPARFVAERLGASVGWDQMSKTVRINTKPCAKCLVLQKEKQVQDKTIKEQEEKIKALEKEIKDLEEKMGKKGSSAEGQPAGNYQKLPLTKVLPAINIAVTGLIEDDHYTRIYLEVENKKEVPVQLLHTRTTAIVDGEVYKSSDILHFALDQRWYHDIDYEELKDGYVMLPPLPEDAKEMLLELTILYNDVAQKTETVEFAIKLAP
jgi:hypothetical protein